MNDQMRIQRLIRHLLLPVVLLWWPATALAGDLVVVVRTAGGAPVRDAVVTLKAAASPPAPIRFAWPTVMAQQNIAFDPFVLIVPVGSDVTFPNRDKVRHHVYSFSAAKKFELKLYGKEEARSVRFDKAGIVALGCNIHDQMIGYLFVTDTPYAAKTNAAGEAVIRGAPAGRAAMNVWHPAMKAPGGQLSRPVTIAQQGGREAVSIELRPMAAMNH